MMSAPPVPVMRSAKVRAWPRPAEQDQRCARAKYMPLAEALSRRWPFDAHVCAYSRADTEHRLRRAALEKLDGVTMVALFVDVDGNDHKANARWREDEREKVRRLRADHPGIICYETRGGYRLVALLEVPHVIRNREDERAWSRMYLLALAWLSRRYGIIGDPACADWTRLYRLPHATRDEGGVPEELPVLGELGVWKIDTDADDEREAERLAADGKVERRFQAARTTWLKEHGATYGEERGPCPAHPREGSGAFARLRDEPGKWCCMSSAHPDGCGREVDSSPACYVGDALDLAAHARGMTPAELLTADGYLKKRTASSASTPGPDAPTIIIGTDEDRVVDEAITALAADPAVFQREGALVRVIDDGEHPPTIQRVPTPALRERMSASANWVVVRERDGEVEHRAAHPPPWAVAALEARGMWRGIRRLSLATVAPTMRPDGSIVAAPGHDSVTGVLFLPRAKFPAVPMRPTAEDVKRAVTSLEDPFCDFPWSAPHDRAAAIAAIMTIVARPALAGPVPLFPVKARSASTGKSLAAETIALAATGRGPHLIASPPPDNEEWRKALLSLQIEAPAVVTIDNVDGDLGSAAFAAVLTSGRIYDRILGKNEMGGGDVRSVFLATGNNLGLTQTLARRAIVIELESEMEHPEDRTGFKHERLREHVATVWPQLAVAALTILRAYHVASRPPHGKSRLGSFEGWDDLIRGACVWAGIGDPDGGRQRTRDEADGDRDALGTALAEWHAAFGTDPRTAAEVVVEAEKKGVVSGALTNPDLNAALSGLCRRGRLDARGLGYALKGVRRKIVRGMRLDWVRGDTSRRWYLEVVGDRSIRANRSQHEPHADEKKPPPTKTESGNGGEHRPVRTDRTVQPEPWAGSLSDVDDDEAWQ